MRHFISVKKAYLYLNFHELIICWLTFSILFILVITYPVKEHHFYITRTCRAIKNIVTAAIINRKQNKYINITIIMRGSWVIWYMFFIVILPVWVLISRSFLVQYHLQWICMYHIPHQTLALSIWNYSGRNQTLLFPF